MSRQRIIRLDTVVKEEDKTDEKTEVLGTEEIVSNSVTMSPSVVPPSVLFNSNLKLLKDFRGIRKQIKQDLMKKTFVDEVKKILVIIDNPNNKYDDEILRFVIESAEHYFTSHKKMGQLKQQAVVEAVEGFFEGNIVVIVKMIKLILPTIVKSNIIIRNKDIIFHFFSSLGKKY